MDQAAAIPELPLTVPPKPLLRGWLHLALFEASLVLGTLMLSRAHGDLRIVALAIFAVSVSAKFGVFWVQCPVSPGYLGRNVATPPAACRSRDDLPAYRRHRDPGLTSSPSAAASGFPAWSSCGCSCSPPLPSPGPCPAVVAVRTLIGYHEVFHAYVCAAATCQYVAIALFIS